MKYFVFGGDQYYPVGGSGDYLGAVDNIADGVRLIKAFEPKYLGADAWGEICDEAMNPLQKWNGRFSSKTNAANWEVYFRAEG